MKKKKVGIVTFVNAFSNGAFLQSYALQTYLEKLGYDVCHIAKNETFTYVNLSKPKMDQYNRLVNYRDEFIHFIDDDISTKYKLYKACEKLDVVITGSDQVWNKNLTGSFFNQDHFLVTIPSSVRRISYAASIGEESLYNDYVGETFKCLLKNMDAISVREDSAKEFLKIHLPYRKIDRHLDPTFLLEPGDYDILTKNSVIDISEKYIYLYLVGVNDDVINYTRKLSEKYGLKVIHNYKPGTFENEKYTLCDTGEFIEYIKNAELVICTSFHALVFSIIFNKKMIPFVAQRGVRLNDLLKLFNLDKLVNPTKLIDLKKYKINYEEINKIIDRERKVSSNYLKKSIEGEVEVFDGFFDVGDKFSCYGCEACKSSCPVDAIDMIEDEEGFIYPQVDKEKCIDCGLCKKKCIYKNSKLVNKDVNFNKKAFVAYLKDDKKISKSTSGGIIQALSDYVLDNGGYVVGVRNDKNFIPYYDISNKISIVDEFRGSKYALPNNNDIYSKTKKILDSGSLVLFSGFSCIVAGLKSYLNKDYDNLITTDFVCHGYPSSKIFRRYLDDLENANGGKIIGVNYRDKSLGWDNTQIRFDYDNNTSTLQPLRSDYFYKMFACNKLQKRSCYNCEFLLDNKSADITVCDFWALTSKIHMDMYNDNKGCSGVIINSLKGMEYFNLISSNCVIKEIPCNDIFESNLSSRILLTEDRFKIFDDLKHPPLSALFSQYVELEKPKMKDVSKMRAIFRILISKNLRKKLKRVLRSNHE